MKNKFVDVMAFSFSMLISLSLLPSILIVNNIEATTTTITPSLSIVSTRGHFWLSSGDLISGHSPTSYSPSITEVAPNCTPDRETVIYVHDWNADEQDALDQFNTVRASLGSLGYVQPIIGFSWDSNTLFSGWDWTNDWQDGKEIAQKNGLKLAKFIFDLKGS